MRLAEVLPRLSDYVARVSKDFPDVLTQVILFGSFAKGTARVGSDVDIAMVARESWSFEDRSDARDLFDDFDCGATLSFFYTTEDGLVSDSKNDANFWIRTEGTVLWSKN